MRTLSRAPAAGRPTTWIGGSSSASFRRVGQYGDGWTTLWEHPDEIESKRARIVDAWEDYGRTGEPEVALMRPVYVGDDTDLDTDTLLVGPADSVNSDVEAYLDAGVTRLVLGFSLSDSVEEQLAQIERIGDEVVPSF